MKDIVEKIFTEVEGWLSNGQYRMYENDGTYYIQKRIPPNLKWEIIFSDENIEVALSKYLAYCQEG